MKRRIKLTPTQWKTLTSALSNMGQAVILFSLAAFFVPESINLSENFSKSFSTLIFVNGFSVLIGAVIISRKGSP